MIAPTEVKARTVTLLALLATQVIASSQGLYTVEPGSGVLQLINPDSGSRTSIGAGLASLGFVLPTDACSPTAIETTGKWIYVLARPANRSGAGDPWHAVAIKLQDGSIHKDYALPPEFPPVQPACAHALSEDSYEHVYISAFVGPPASARLVVGRFYSQNDSYAGLFDEPVAPWGLGGGVAVPSSAVTDTTLWVTLSGGLAGLSLTSLQMTQRLPSAQPLLGLQYGVAPRLVFGVQTVNQSASVLVSFDPATVPVPTLNYVGLPFSGTLARPNFAALQSDTNAMSFIIFSGPGNTTVLATHSLDDGTAVGPLFPMGITPPLLLTYLPFVFQK